MSQYGLAISSLKFSSNILQKEGSFTWFTQHDVRLNVDRLAARKKERSHPTPRAMSRLNERVLFPHDNTGGNLFLR